MVLLYLHNKCFIICYQNKYENSISRTVTVVSKGQNIFVLLKVVMVHIKLNGMENRAPRKYTFCPYTHPQPHKCGQKVKTFFLKVVTLHIKLTRMDHTAPCKHILCPLYTYTLLTLGWGQSSKYGLSESSHVAYQSNGSGA